MRRAKVEPAKEGEEVQAIAADEDGTAVRGLATKSERCLCYHASHILSFSQLHLAARHANDSYRPPIIFNMDQMGIQPVLGVSLLRPPLTMGPLRFCSGLTDVHITRLGEAEIGKFFDLPAAIIPEAFQAHYSSAAERRETVVEKGGCKGLQVGVLISQLLHNWLLPSIAEHSIRVQECCIARVMPCS